MGVYAGVPVAQPDVVEVRAGVTVYCGCMHASLLHALLLHLFKQRVAPHNAARLIECFAPALRKHASSGCVLQGCTAWNSYTVLLQHWLLRRFLTMMMRQQALGSWHGSAQAPCKPGSRQSSRWRVSSISATAALCGAQKAALPRCCAAAQMLLGFLVAASAHACLSFTALPCRRCVQT